jgi:hypothetical protein
MTSRADQPFAERVIVIAGVMIAGYLLGYWWRRSPSSAEIKKAQRSRDGPDVEAG